MSRVIAGSAGGRTLATPRGSGTRPTSDRVRESLFSRVEHLLDLDGARVLDLYAGSGALGIEALSRGAGALLAVEADRAASAVIARNARLVPSAAVEVRTAKVATVLAHGRSGDPFDLVLIDPPYDVAEDEIGRVLTALVAGAWLTPDALVVLERSARSPAPAWPTGLAHRDTRRYGDTAVHLADPSDIGRAP